MRGQRPRETAPHPPLRVFLAPFLIKKYRKTYIDVEDIKVEPEQSDIINQDKGEGEKDIMRNKQK